MLAGAGHRLSMILGSVSSTARVTIPVDPRYDTGSHLPRYSSSWQRQGNVRQGAGECGADHEPPASSASLDSAPDELGRTPAADHRLSLPATRLSRFQFLRAAADKGFV